VGERTLGYVTLPGRLFDDGIRPDAERLPLLLGVAESFGSGIVLTGKHCLVGDVMFHELLYNVWCDLSSQI